MTVSGGRLVQIERQASQGTLPRYYLSNVNGGPIKFKLLKFDATAKPDSSYVDENGKIHLNVELEAKIPHAQLDDGSKTAIPDVHSETFKIKIPDMVLDNNQVYPATGAPLKIKLGQWTLEAKNWEFSAKEGGIHSSDALIHTSALDIPITSFVLRDDFFAMLKPKMDKMVLGDGVTTVNVDINKANAILQWDNKVGVDMTGHWRLSITSKTAGQPAATTGTFAGLYNSSGSLAPLNIEYVELLDNNQGRVQLGNNPTFKILNNSLASFTLQSIYNGAGYINLTGMLNIGAPNVGNMRLMLTYTKPGTTQVMKPEKVDLDFVSKAQVHFISDNVPNQQNIFFTTDEIRIEGRLEEKPDPTFNPMPATLYAYAKNTNPNRYKIDIPKDWVTQLTEATTDTKKETSSPVGYRLKIEEGRTYVNNSNQWTNLTYTGIMYDNMKSDGIKDPKMTFTVLGAVSANSDQLGLSGMDTPFGKLNLTYEFANSRLIGNLNAKGAVLGPITVIEGEVEFLCDPKGFYVAGGAATLVAIPFIQGKYNLGFMIGYYPDQSTVNNRIWPLVTRYTTSTVENKCYLKQISSKLAGFYFTVDRVMFDVNKNYSPIVNVKAYGAIGVDIFGNFISPVSAGVSGRARLNAGVSAYLPGIPIISVGTDVNSLARFDFGVYGSSGFKASLDLKMDFGTYIKGCVPYVYCKEFFRATINCHAHIGSDGFQFNLSGGGANFDYCD